MKITMKTISDNNMDIPRTKKEWEEYYKLKKRAEKLFKEKGICVDYS